ncbi:hypothetical protein QUA81_23035 [Microcoleus sp. F6_B4]
MRTEWGMGNGEWGMGHGEWGMGHGAWGIIAERHCANKSPLTNDY